MAGNKLFIYSYAYNFKDFLLEIEGSGDDYHKNKRFNG